MSDGRGQEYLDENFCSHDNVYVDYVEILKSGNPITWKQTEGEELLVTIRCYKCGQAQNHTLDLYEVVEDLNLGWQE